MSTLWSDWISRRRRRPRSATGMHRDFSSRIRRRRRSHENTGTCHTLRMSILPTLILMLGVGTMLYLTRRILPSRLVMLVDELEKKELVKRHDDPGDRRSYALYLTPKGRK